MREFLTLGPAPYAEDCVQVSDNELYLEKMKDEARRYVDMLMKRFPILPGGMRFGIKKEQHDFGPYYEVVIHFDDEAAGCGDGSPIDWAYFIESNCPAKWTDDEVFLELKGE